MPKKLTLDFGNLPLAEAAVRISFAQPIKLTFALLNRVHGAIEAEFPSLTEPSSIEHPPGIASFTIGPPGQLLLGAVYGGNSVGLQISLQPQVVVARWVQAHGSKELHYPRFQAVRDALRSVLKALANAHSGELPPIAVVNMSYVNIVQIPHATCVIERYFAPSAHLGIAVGAREVFKIEASWKGADGVDVKYNLEQVHTKIGDESVEAYGLTTAAGSRVAQDEESWDILEAIHDRLQSFFVDVLSDHAKTEWQLKVHESHE